MKLLACIILRMGVFLEHAPCAKYHSLRSFGSDLYYLGHYGHGRYDHGAWWYNGPEPAGRLYPSRIPAPKWRLS